MAFGINLRNHLDIPAKSGHLESYPGNPEKQRGYPRFQVKCHMKISAISQLFLGSLNRFWLFNIQTVQQPIQLPPGDALCFGTFSRPAVTSLRDAEPFIQEHVSIRFMKQNLDAVTALPTEKEQGRLIWIHGQLIPDNAAKTINGFAHVCRPTFPLY